MYNYCEILFRRFNVLEGLQGVYIISYRISFFSWSYRNHITRISIQTAGLAFGSTGLICVLIVLGSCAEHLTVESYTVFICQQSHLLLSGIPSTTDSFIPGLKPSFSENHSHRSPSSFFFNIHYMDSRTVYCYFWAYMYLFSTFSFSVFTLFSCRFRAVD